MLSKQYAPSTSSQLTVENPRRTHRRSQSRLPSNQAGTRTVQRKRRQLRCALEVAREDEMDQNYQEAQFENPGAR